MGNLPESTINLILSGLMGAISGLITLPLNAYILWNLKRNEISYQHKLDVIAKERELLLAHRLELKKIEQGNNDLNEVKASIRKLEQRLLNNE